jgi:hypothetical protein
MKSAIKVFKTCKTNPIDNVDVLVRVSRNTYEKVNDNVGMYHMDEDKIISYPWYYGPNESPADIDYIQACMGRGLSLVRFLDTKNIIILKIPKHTMVGVYIKKKDGRGKDIYLRWDSFGSEGIIFYGDSINIVKSWDIRRVSGGGSGGSGSGNGPRKNAAKAPARIAKKKYSSTSSSSSFEKGKKGKAPGGKGKGKGKAPARPLCKHPGCEVRPFGGNTLCYKHRK